MSTYLYLECQDHDPPLRASGESGQHLSNLPEIRKMIEKRSLIVLMLKADLSISFENHFDNNTARFLHAHPTCKIRIVDMYGEYYEITEPQPAEPGLLEQSRVDEEK